MKSSMMMPALLVIVLFAGSAFGAEPTSPSRGYRAEEVYGCYHEEEHTCDCGLTADECDAKNDGEGNHFHTDLCADWCSAPDPSRMAPGCLKFSEDGAHSCACSTPRDSCEAGGNIVTEACACTQGCYDEATHECDCDLSSDECTADSAFFTSLCSAKCSDPVGFMPGCLSFDDSGSHGCKCDVSKDECDSNDDIWTDSCDCTEEDVLGCYGPDHTCDCEISREECEAKEDHDWSGLCSDKCIYGDSVTTGCLVFEDSGAHECRCSVPQSACTGDQRVFTESCVCHPGCYDEESHECDCDSSADECGAGGNSSEFFTAMCDSKCANPALHTPGCLISEPGSHSCDCERDEEECGNDNGIWTDSCQCFKPAGCYTMESHTCDCSTSEADCLSGNVEGERPAFYWTETCLGTGGEDCSYDDFGIREEGNSPGCFDIVQHECDCDLYEDECTVENLGTGVRWIDECNCPGRPAQLEDN